LPLSSHDFCLKIGFSLGLTNGDVVKGRGLLWEERENVFQDSNKKKDVRDLL
jgi:hypothetical protein